MARHVQSGDTIKGASSLAFVGGGLLAIALLGITVTGAIGPMVGLSEGARESLKNIGWLCLIAAVVTLSVLTYRVAQTRRHEREDITTPGNAGGKQGLR